MYIITGSRGLIGFALQGAKKKRIKYIADISEIIDENPRIC